jgi:excisionase family DNA binding protein
MSGLTLEELRAAVGKYFMTVKEGAQLLDVDPRTLRRSIEAGECPHVRVSGSVRIPVAAFLRWAGIDLEDSEAAPDQRGSRSDIRPLKAIRHGNSHPVAG